MGVTWSNHRNPFYISKNSDLVLPDLLYAGAYQLKIIIAACTNTALIITACTGTLTDKHFYGDSLAM